MRMAVLPHVLLPEHGSKLQTASDEINADVTVQAT